MMLTLALIPAVLLLALLILAACYGGTVAQRLQDRRYARQELLSTTRAGELYDARLLQDGLRRVAQAEQVARHAKKEQLLHEWSRDFYKLLQDTGSRRGRGI